MIGRKKVKNEDLLYVSQVDRAMYGRGRGFAYVMYSTIILFVAAFVVWSKYAVLDEVTRGMGRVIPSQRVQEIQNLEGGILSEIFVSEGEQVKKDALLCRLHNAQAASSYRDAYARSLEHEAAIIRLKAQLNDAEPVFPESLVKEEPALVEEQKMTYRAQIRQFDVEVSLFEDQVLQKEQEVTEMVSRKRQLQRNLRVATEQRDIALPLMKKQIHSKMDYLALEQRVLELQGDIEALRLGIPRAKIAVDEAKGRVSKFKAERAAILLEEINKRRVELTSLKETLSAGSDRVTRTDVRSPVKGIIKRIMINTLGGVVRPGESIMEVVPLDDTLLVEAEIRPADIAFLHPGQKAMVKITAYDFSIYGGLDGIVEHISADTIQDERGEEFYVVKVRTKKNVLLYRGENLPIIPGMTAQVDVLTGKKSVLDYLLKPILKAKQNALRER